MKKIIITVGFIFAIGSVWLIVTNYKELEVERNGTIVKMRIEKMPMMCLGTKSRYFVVFNYGGKLYDKQIRGSFCQRHHIGELVEMRFYKGSSTLLFPHESVVLNLISFGILGVLGIVIIIIQWKKNKN